MPQHSIGTRAEWQAARDELAKLEAEQAKQNEEIKKQRLDLPWVPVEKEYRFEGPNGPATLLDVFEGRKQLVLYRFFYDPDVTGWPDRGCFGCSFGADQVAHPAHLNARNTTLAYASRAPQENIQRMKAEMGWEHIPWYGLTDDFDKDFGVDEWHGTNAFIRDGDQVYRTYFVDARGDEQMGSTWNYLDITALGRQEKWEDSPEGYPQDETYQWWIWHDEPSGDGHRPGAEQLEIAKKSGLESVQ